MPVSIEKIPLNEDWSPSKREVILAVSWLALLRRAIVISILVLFPRIALALPLSAYLAIRANPETKDRIDDYVMGAGQGVFWTATMFEIQKQVKLFCFPPKLTIDGSLVKSLLNQEIDNPADGRPYAQDTQVELIIIKSFMVRFPCKP